MSTLRRVIIDDLHYLTGNLHFRNASNRSVNSNAQFDYGCDDANEILTAGCTNITQGSGTTPNSIKTNNLGLNRYTGDINFSLVCPQPDVHCKQTILRLAPQGTPLILRMADRRGMQ